MNAAALKMPSDPRILFIGENAPYGPMNGGGLRTRVTIEALASVGRVTFLPVIPEPWSVDAVAETARRFELAPPIRFHSSEKRQRLSARIQRNVSPRCMDTDGFQIDGRDEAVVDRELRHAELVWIYQVRRANLLRRWHWPRTVLDIDDLASRFELTQAVVSTRAQRIRALWRAWLWRRREKLFDERFRHLVVSSEDDRRYLRSTSRVHVIPNTFDDSNVTVVRSPAAHPRFGFIGHLGYPPNRDAIDWFGRYVWPDIVCALPDSELRIVGSESEFLRARHLPGVALGYVADPTDEMATWTAMIVPVRIGGGTRVKISEAFVRRIPVIATRLGAFGYDVANDRELLLADDPRAFAHACIRIFTEPGLAERLTVAGSELYNRDHSIAAVRGRIAVVAAEALREERGSVDP